MALKSHLGCGKRYLPGWTHVDLADFPHIDYRQDGRLMSLNVTAVKSGAKLLDGSKITLGLTQGGRL